MKIRMTFMMIMLVFSGLLTNVYGESYQRWTEVPGRVLTSNDFLADPALVAHNDDLILIFLDAAEIPEVSIPYENSQTHTRTICWDQEDSSHTATLVDESGNPVFTLGPGECVSPTIEAGFYTLRFTHDSTSEPATFVLQPTSGEGGGAETGVSPNYSQEDMNRLKKTNQCPCCYLPGANLSGAILDGAILRWADLTGADLTRARLYMARLHWADLIGADLRGAKFYQSDFTGADLSYSDLKNADLSGAILIGADLRKADLSYAFMTGSDLAHADLRGADLSRSYLIGANLTGADLTDAKWVDGSQCGSGSIGMCAPIRTN